MLLVMFDPELYFQSQYIFWSFYFSQQVAMIYNSIEVQTNRSRAFQILSKKRDRLHLDTEKMYLSRKTVYMIIQCCS